MQQNEKDIEILKALYYGNHLSEAEIKRAVELIYLLKIGLEKRIEVK